MQFIGSTKKQRTPATPITYANGRQISLYVEPPCAEISIEEFESCALDRLRVLKDIESMKMRGKSDDDLYKRVLDLWDKHMKEPTRQASHQKDVTSHYVLRLAYCQTPDLRRWLVQMEAELFKHRFRGMELQQEKVQFFESTGLPYRVIAEDEFSRLKEPLAAVAAATVAPSAALTAAAEIMNGANRGFYKVPFEEVPDLVAGRRVLLHQGWAYVGKDQLASVVVGHLRKTLEQGLRELSVKWSQYIAYQERDRLAPLLEALSTKHLGEKYTGEGAKGDVTAASLPALAARHFPLCMSNMFDTLAADKHLKFDGRRQLGLFLKSIGLPLEEAVVFWRTAFSPRTNTEQFNKQYLYDIRYQYGQEGARRNMAGHSCVAIVNSLPGAGQCHGCPFRTFNEQQLRTALQRKGCADKSIDEAVRKAAGKHYQLACAAAFEGITHTPCDTGINHPTQYFMESRRAAEGRDKDRAPPATPAAPLPQARTPLPGGGAAARGWARPPVTPAPMTGTPLAGTTPLAGLHTPQA